MSKLFYCLVLCLSSSLVVAAPLDIVGADDASQTEYGSGWESNKGGGDGFGKWNLQITTTGAENSHAGFYIATTSDKSDLNGIAMNGKAFGLYANGEGFECAVAYRTFNRALQPGQSFSLQLEHGDFVQKFDKDDSGGGSCGFTLLPSGDHHSADEYNKDVRFEFGFYKNDGAYMIYDADGPFKLSIPMTDSGLSITFTLVTADTYNLEVTVLNPKSTLHFDGRKLGGAPGSDLNAFCLFNRNSERDDVYFNGLQLLQPPAGK